MRPLILLALAAAVGASAARAADSTAEERGTADGLAAFWQDQRVSTALRSDYFRSSKVPDGGANLFGATAQFKALPRFSETVDGKIEWRVSDPAIGNSGNGGKGGETGGRLLEGYLGVHFEKADLRIGRQIVAWGRADGINPTDNLTPRNYAVMLPFEDDQRFGTPAARLDYYLSQAYTVTVFATPLFEPSKIPLPANSGQTFIDSKPRQTLSNTEAGLKLNQVSDGFDWSVSAYSGFTLLPQMRLLANGPVTSSVELRYARISVFGADFARNFGRFGLRGEVAYGRSADTRTSDPGAKRSYLSWAAGADRTFFENLNVNLQFFQRRVRDYQAPDSIAPPAERGVALQSAIVNGQRDPINNGASFRITNKWLNDALEFEVFTVLNLTRSDHLTRPMLTYAFSDHWKGTIGAEFYVGAGDTQFGSLKNSRGVFAELRYGL